MDRLKPTALWLKDRRVRLSIKRLHAGNLCILDRVLLGYRSVTWPWFEERNLYLRLGLAGPKRDLCTWLFLARP